MKAIIEIHLIQNFAPANLNRDDAGAPKDTLFGGTRRARISSQCQKRAVRDYFRDNRAALEIPSENLGVRTKRILGKIVADLVEKGRNTEEATVKVQAAFDLLSLSTKDDGKSQYLLFLGEKQVAALGILIHERWEEFVTNDTTKDKKAKKAKIGSDLEKAVHEILGKTDAVDIALFGRMLADVPELNQNASCQVAHAVSTHIAERDFDYFTAVDDLKPEDTAGADMIGTIEFNASCYYRYAALDWQLLVDNLGQDGDLARIGLAAFLEAFILSEPKGKQNTFAAHNPPEFVAISVRKDCPPRNLANAFEVPVILRAGESLTAKSVAALVKKAGMLDGAYGRHGDSWILNLSDADTGAMGHKVEKLDTLIDLAVAATGA